MFVVVAAGDVTDPVCCCENPEEGYSITTAYESASTATEGFILSSLCCSIRGIIPLSAAGPRDCSDFASWASSIASSASGTTKTARRRTGYEPMREGAMAAFAKSWRAGVEFSAE